jgi:hypothetical protein
MSAAAVVDKGTRMQLWQAGPSRFGSRKNDLNEFD